MDYLPGKPIVVSDAAPSKMPRVEVPDSLAVAIDTYRQAVEQAPPVRHSESQPELGNDVARLRHCERCLVDVPGDAQLWYQRGEALANLGDHQNALHSFQQTLVLAPEHVEAWVFQAVMLIQLTRYQEALASTERAIALQPEHEEAWTFRGVALRYLGRYREAYASYDRALGIERPSLRQRVTQISKGLLRHLGL